MKPRKLKPRKKIVTPPNPASKKIRYPYGPNHDFWLFHEGERAYKDYWDLLGREDAPARLPFEIVEVLGKELSAFPVVSPGKRNNTLGSGLYFYGPNIINETGGAAFSAICRQAAKDWARGPELLIIELGTSSTEGNHKPPKPFYFKIDRDLLVRELETLAGWGEKAATGAFFILHLGI